MEIWHSANLELLSAFSTVAVLFWYFKPQFIGCWRRDKSYQCASCSSRAFRSKLPLKWNWQRAERRANCAKVDHMGGWKQCLNPSHSRGKTLPFFDLIHLLNLVFDKLSESDFLLTAIINEMKRVQLRIQEEKEKEKKIYAKMFAWGFHSMMQWIVHIVDQYLKLSLKQGSCT